MGEPAGSAGTVAASLKAPAPRPLAIGSVSLRLYPHEVDAVAVMGSLREQAIAASLAGFDGVMVSEHHAGFVGYHPNPVQLAGFLLAVMPQGWAAPCPLLLPLRAPGLVVEELAWLAAAYPGRVGAGFASGSLPVDFEVAEVPYDQAVERFTRALPEVVAHLRGRGTGPVAADRAVSRLDEDPVPMVVAAQSAPAVRRAAAHGVGVLFDSLQTPEVIRRLTDIYRDAGGDGPSVLIRRLWVGPVPTEAFAAQTERYRSYAAERAMSTWGGDELVSGASPSEAAERLVEVVERSGCDTVNLRLHAAGLRSVDIVDQLERHASDLVAMVRHGLDQEEGSA